MTEKIRSGGLSGSTLKIIAIITMLIDHFGLAIWYRLPQMGYLVPEVMTTETWLFIYRCMRNIGRTAFPIYCFLLVEGLFWTSNRLKYVVRLFVFAFLSEFPFKLAFLGFGVGTNVFFTLSLGLSAIAIMEAVGKGLDRRRLIATEKTVDRRRLSGADEPAEKRGFLLTGSLILISVVARLSILAIFGWVAWRLNTDYDWRGIMLIGILYFLRPSRLMALTAGYLSYLWEAFCLPGFILLWFYNGKRGIRLKYLFYTIYPLHLTLFYVIWKYLL
ncbi:MAG: conjugal transfer protein TraX [Lachnospiraceae bacterium]|nr:conjugal transfer protein TraX [Lachnospiraceae bacterium]